jgi:hypothetical protein
MSRRLQVEPAHLKAPHRERQQRRERNRYRSINRTFTTTNRRFRSGGGSFDFSA